jgi:allantoicase
MKSFIMTSDKGLSYSAGIWRKSPSASSIHCKGTDETDHPVLILDSTLDLACVETQVHTGVRDSDPRDCELLEYEGENVFGRVAVPL